MNTNCSINVVSLCTRFVVASLFNASDISLKKKRIRILLDGENLLHAEPAKSAWEKFGIKILAGWPKYPTERQVDKSCTYMHGSTVKLEAHSEPSNWSPWEGI